MTGAENALRIAVSHGVRACFANPGTTEMDLVSALDSTEEMRSILCLFEGVCTGMADGYARMAGHPALTLLHLGVGLGNGIANLHNARRARSAIVNIVGEHVREHVAYDAPLTSDIATMARPVSDWVHTIASVDDAGKDMARAIHTARGRPGKIATLIAPADTMRETTTSPVLEAETENDVTVDVEAVEGAAAALRSGEPSALLLSGPAVLEPGLRAAHRVAFQTSCKVMCDCFPARLDRGAGLPQVERLPYFPELVLERLAGLKHLILAGCSAPVSFFKYDEYPSSLIPEGCTVHVLSPPDVDAVPSLLGLADSLDAPEGPIPVVELSPPDAPTGELTTRSVGAAVAAALPEGAIIADESATSGGPAYFLTQNCPPHSSMYLTGGGIGWGMPAGTGAAVACPDRQVLVLQGDGGGMYTLQALWTQARECLNVTNIIFSNRCYQILQVEQQRTGLTSPGDVAQQLTELNNPAINWCQLAQGLGVPASRPENAEDLYSVLQRSFVEPGPHLVEVVL